MGCFSSKMIKNAELIELDSADKTAKSSEQNNEEMKLESASARLPIVSLTMPTFPNFPSRPEFIPFRAHLCDSISRQLDGKDFWTYPDRCGWIIHAKDMHCHVFCPPTTCHHGLNLDELFHKSTESRVRPPMFSRSDGRPVLASDKVAFLQAWLFFGVLTEVSKLCGLEIDITSEFIVDNGSFFTAGLNGLPQRWFEAAFRAGRAGDKMLMERILTVARHSYLMLSEELVSDHTLRFKYTYDECRILHSLHILVRIMGLHLLLHIYMPGFSATDEEGWGKDRVSKSLNSLGYYYEGMDQLSDLARDDLEEQGWCESELDLLEPEQLAFASLLPRPRIRDHSSCGDVICNAYQTDEATYKTRHAEDGCTCDFVGVDTDALIAALSQNKVPKLVITEDLGFQVVSEDDYPYIALSHVWADGLGNPVLNALPQCQLRRLQGYANNLGRILNPGPEPLLSSLPVAFWMDTLCIPVHPSAKEYRKKAIQLLAKTFHQAVAVLILDRELEIVKSTTATFLELGLRILCSGWMKRLWTLQEATLASEARGTIKLYFQMQDGPFLYQKYDRDRKALHSLDERTTEIQAEERKLLLDDGVMLELGAQIPSVRAMRSMREGWSPFRVIYSAIEHRSTSRAEDVPLCITSLLDKDLITILSVSGAEQRMAQFYLLMREIPIGVLWADHPEKLGIKPFRWASKSITDCAQSVYMGWEDGICDLAGFHVQLRGFVLADSVVKLGESGEGKAGPLPLLPLIFDITSIDTGDIFAKLSWKRQIPLQKNMALIFRPVNGGAQGKYPNAVLVIVEKTVAFAGNDESEFVCRIIGYLDALKPVGVGGANGPVFQGYVTKMDQRWCIT